MDETEEAQNLLENTIHATADNPAFLPEWASANANLADIAFETEQLDKAAQLLKKARRGFKVVGDHGGLARVCGTLGKIWYARGKHEDAVIALQMALWHARVSWDVTGEARLLNNLGTMQRALSLPDAAEASYRRASELGRRVGDPEPEVVAAMGMVAVDLVRGQLRKAGRRARSCLKAAERLGLNRLAMQTRGNLALALIASGEYRKALRMLRVIAPFFEAHGPSEQAAFTLRNIGVCLGALGRTD
ncbi:MAG: hypothetical protein PVJ57_03535 [Phycisphaerae bacterium]|jgi:tetratricopeptide (TPR) repeat protein